MSIRVFDWSANPAVDPFNFRLSNARALALVASRSHFITKDGQGRTVIQKYPPPEERENHAHYDDAWKIKTSGGIPVWQMVTV